jgi:hypothetical protein
VLCSYAIVAYVGLRASLADIWINIVSWLYVPAAAPRRRPSSRRSAPVPVARDVQLSDWESVLYLGSLEGGRVPRPTTNGNGASAPAAPVGERNGHVSA